MNRALFCLFLVLFVCKLLAQQGNIWHFGNFHTIDFNAGVPVVGLTSSMQTFEGCASICDADGNLLFYTNGGGRQPASGQSTGIIWNKNHEVMYDMQGLEGGGFSARQSSVIIPKPSDPSKYLIFTMEELEFNVGGNVVGQPNGRGLSYFEVDMNLNGGLGGVSDYEETIYEPTYEGLCAIRHDNGNDYWVLIHGDENQSIYIYPVTAAGVGVPVISNYSGFSSIICASPNREKVVLQGNDNNLLLDFDASTGALTNPITVENYGVPEFSPNSEKIFFVSENQISFFNMDGSPSPDDYVLLANVDELLPEDLNFLTNLQLGPDGNIYFVRQIYDTGIAFLCVVKCPNTNPIVEFDILQLPDFEDFYFNLPNFTDHLFESYEQSTLFVDLGEDLILCNGDEVVLQDLNNNSGSFSWSNGQSESAITVFEEGLYSVSVTDGCAIGVDSVFVTTSNVFLEIEEGTDFCYGDSVELNATISPDASIFWQPATFIANPTDTQTTAVLSQSTTFLATVQLGNCVDSSSVTYTLIEPLLATTAFVDTAINIDQQIVLDVTNGETYEWLEPNSDLSCNDCANPTVSPSGTENIYTVVVNEAGFCPDTISFSIQVILPDCDTKLPNAFTPNGDQLNDFYAPIGNVGAYNLEIYSRFGKLVYSGSLPWDGQINGEEGPSDVYKAILYLEQPACPDNLRTLISEVSLIR